MCTEAVGVDAITLGKLNLSLSLSLNNAHHLITTVMSQIDDDCAVAVVLDDISSPPPAPSTKIRSRRTRIRANKSKGNEIFVILLFIIIDLLTSVSNLVVNKEDAAHALTNAAPSESQQNGK